MIIYFQSRDQDIGSRPFVPNVRVEVANEPSQNITQAFLNPSRRSYLLTSSMREEQIYTCIDIMV